MTHKPTHTHPLSLPSVLLPVVVSSGEVRVVDLLSLHGPHKHARLACLFGQAVVDVGDDGEGGSWGVAEAYIDPVIPATKQQHHLLTRVSPSDGGNKTIQGRATAFIMDEEFFMLYRL